MKNPQIELYFDKENKVYYYDGEIDRCELCRTPFHEFLVFSTQFSKGKTVTHRVCGACNSKIPRIGLAFETKAVLIGHDIIDEYTPVVIRPPELVGGNISVFDLHQMPDCKTVDRTKYSKQPSIEGARIGAVDMARLEAQDDEINTLAGVKLLESVKNRIPIVPVWKPKKERYVSLDTPDPQKQIGSG
jgi:hypothetical protein